MTLTLNGGTHFVQIAKEGVIYDRSNLPYFFNSIESVEATITAGNIANVKVTLTPSYRDAIKILRSGLLGVGVSSKGQKPETTNESEGSRLKTSTSLNANVSTASTSSRDRILAESLESTNPYIAVKFLYPGQLDNDGSQAETPTYTGVMLKPQIDISGTDITITINSVAYSSFLTIAKGTVSFKNIPAIDVITELASPLDLKVVAADAQTTSVLSKKITGVYNESRMDVIERILRQLDCLMVTSDGQEKKPESQILIKCRQSILTDKIKFTFVLFRNINTSLNIFPIYDFSLESDESLFLPGAVFGSLQKTIDEKNKEKTALATDSTTSEGQLLTGLKDTTAGAIPTGEKNSLGGATGFTNVSDPELSGESSVLIKRSDANNESEIETATKQPAFYGVTYNLTVPGIPKLAAMDVVQVIVENQIPGLSGTGWVESFTHRSGSDGWTTNMKFNQYAALVSKPTDRRDTEDLAKQSQGNTKISIPI